MIDVSHLSKKYGSVTAVDDISFHADRHEIVGFLGRNGAGKSTTMNIMTGYLSATAGSVRICGADIELAPEEAKSHLGYLPELPPLYMDLTVQEFLRYACAVKRVSSRSVKEHIDEICERTGIAHVRKRLIRNLSKGYRQRVGLANALVGNPEVILLDEPSVGLDPQQNIEMRQCIRSLGKDHTVLLSSHILSEVAQICDRLVIIEKGRIAAQDSVDNLLHTSDAETYSLRIAGDTQAAAEKLAELDGVTAARAINAYELLVDISHAGGEDTLKALFYRLHDLDFPMLELKRRTESLEDVFIRLTGSKGGI